MARTLIREGTPVITRMAMDAVAVALTFDDCDDEDAWRSILDTLLAHEVRATFFALGMRVRQFPEVAARTAAEGHAIGSHGWDHADPLTLPPAELRARLLADLAIWQEIAGPTTLTLFRPPLGHFDRTTALVAASVGFERLVLWDVDPRDWEFPPPQTIVERVLSSVQRGSIIDLHVTRPTAAALSALIEGLRSDGFEVVPLSSGALTRGL
jgi:peptidoglycan/xylan/chitin deacetylase (PgdA/CDA1 family)